MGRNLASSLCLINKDYKEVILTPPSREVISSLWRFLNDFHKNYWIFCMQHNLPHKPDLIWAHMTWGTNMIVVISQVYFVSSFSGILFFFTLYFQNFDFDWLKKTFSIFLGSLERIFFKSIFQNCNFIQKEFWTRLNSTYFELDWS